MKLLSVSCARAVQTTMEITWSYHNTDKQILKTQQPVFFLHTCTFKWEQGLQMDSLPVR